MAKELHSHVYYGGQIGLSNARMSVELAMVLGYLTNRHVYLYQDKPIQHSNKFFDELFDLPQEVTLIRQVNPDERLPAISQYMTAVHATKNVPADFLAGRKQVLVTEYRNFQRIRTPDHMTLGFYSNLFYMDEGKANRVYEYLRASLVPKVEYVDIAQECVWNLWQKTDGFNSVHIRRGDKLSQGQPEVSCDFMAVRLASMFDKNKRLAIHTDEKDRNFFKPILDRFKDVVFVEDLLEEYNLDGAESGLVSSLIAGFSDDFVGTLGSTLSSYMQRHRIYEGRPEMFRFLYPMFHAPLNQAGQMVPLSEELCTKASWSCLDLGRGKKNNMSDVMFWAREWPEVIPNDWKPSHIPLEKPQSKVVQSAIKENIIPEVMVKEESVKAELTSTYTAKAGTMQISNAITEAEQDAIIVKMHSTKLQDESGDPHYKNSFGMGYPLNDPLFAKIFDRLTPEVESIAGHKLEPSGLYARIYRNGSYLKPHIDRPDLQYTASVCIVAPDKEWPLFVEGKDGVNYAIDIRPRGAAVMNGTDNKHWREDLVTDEDDMAMYVFFHWKKKEQKKSVLADTWYYVEDNFLDPAAVQRCLELIGQCEFVPTMVKEGDVIRENPAVRSNRTTNTATHPAELNAMISIIEQKIEDRLQIERGRQEKMQILKYAKGQYFTPHMDCPFRPENDREYTYIVYLTKVEDGGQTKFNNAGVTIDAVPGRLLVWKNMQNNECVPSAMHEGAPVKAGKKIVFVNWIAQRPL